MQISAKSECHFKQADFDHVVLLFLSPLSPRYEGCRNRRKQYVIKDAWHHCDHLNKLNEYLFALLPQNCG